MFGEKALTWKLCITSLLVFIFSFVLYLFVFRSKVISRKRAYLRLVWQSVFHYTPVFQTLLEFLLEIGQEFPFNGYFNRTIGRRSVHQYLLEGLQRSRIRRRRYLLAGCKRNCTRFLRNCDSSRIAWKRRTKAMRSLAIGNLPPWWWTGTFFT